MSTILNWGKGGLPMESHLDATRISPIPNASIPPKCIVPLRSFEGQDIQWKTGPGERVDEGAVIASGLHGVLHSPIPGVVENIVKTLLPEGLETTAAHIRLEGSFYRTTERKAPESWAARSAADLISDLKSAGVLFCSSPLGTLKPVREGRARILVINALQPEPYFTLSTQILMQYPQEIHKAIQILQKIYEPETTLLAVHTDLAPAYQAEPELPFGVTYAEYRYPAAHEKLLVKALRRQKKKIFQEVDDGSILMVTPQVLYWVHEALVHGRPVLDRFVVYGGSGFHHGGIIKARIGTPAANLILDVGGLKDTPEVIIQGGIHLGRPLEGLWSPVTKGSQGLLALSTAEVHPAKQLPCIRCGACKEYCPVGLEPLELDLSLRTGNFTRAEAEGVRSCIECGLCSSLCPSRIPLMEGFQKYLKSPEADRV